MVGGRRGVGEGGISSDRGENNERGEIFDKHEDDIYTAHTTKKKWGYHNTPPPVLPILPHSPDEQNGRGPYPRPRIQRQEGQIQLLRELHQRRHERQHRTGAAYDRHRLRRRERVHDPASGGAPDHLHRANGAARHRSEERAEPHRGREAREEEEQGRREALDVQTVEHVGLVQRQAHAVIAEYPEEERFEEGRVPAVVPSLVVDDVVGCGGGGGGGG